MMQLFVFSSLIVFLSSCNRTTINEASEKADSEQKVLVMVDEGKCKTAWGETLLSGESRKAFRRSETATCKESCDQISETIVCKDGKLTNGDVYIYPTCNRPKCDCKMDFLPNAPTIKHGDFVKLYTKQSIECKSCDLYEVQRQCVDGVLTGDAAAKYQSCDSIACKDCPVSANFFVKHSESRVFYKSTTGLNCDAQKKCESSAQSQTRICENGVLSGDSTYNQLTCTNEMCSCTVQNSTFKHNDTVVYYTKSESKCTDNYACTDAGVKVTSKCNDGKIEGLPLGQTIFNKCVPELCKCTFKDALGVESILNDGQTIPVFTQPNVACGVNCNTIQGSIRCDRGKLSGQTSSGYTSCSSQSCGCMHGEVRIENNQTKEVYSMTSPTCGTKCDSIKGQVTCKDGKLTGNLELKAMSCLEQTCDCSYTNSSGQKVTLANGTIDAPVWQKSTATCGETCDGLKGKVSCANTILTGNTNLTASTCTEQKCMCTTPWNTTVVAGATYEAASKIAFYKMDKSTCGRLKCNQTAELTKRFACVRQGNTTVWMDEQKNVVADFPVYKFSGCADPSCSCSVFGKSISEGTVKSYYKKNKVACGEVCESASNYVSITCNADLTYKVTPESINLESFFGASPPPATSCVPDECPPGSVIGSPGGGGNGTGKYGDGGGTGGGTGDGEGIGIGFGGRTGVGTGGGGPGRISTIRLNAMLKVGSTEACELPWGGKISHGASFIAFTRQTAEAGKKCGSYRVNRICLDGKLSGDNLGKYLKCEEP